MGIGREILPTIESINSYEEYITGLIYFRNELESLIDSWPKAKDGNPLLLSACPEERANRFRARLSALITGYEYTMHRYSQSAIDWIVELDTEMESRPAGLPTLPGADRLERKLLSEIEHLLTELLNLKAQVTESGRSENAPPLNRMQWLVSYLTDWK